MIFSRFSVLGLKPNVKLCSARARYKCLPATVVTEKRHALLPWVHLPVSVDQRPLRIGKEVSRFRAVPRPGEPGSETWQGGDIEHGGAPTWLTGSYDPELDTVYWPTGNPSEEYNGDHRKGDNLYSDCILALERKTGKLKWCYQSTPHDLWDWDATETPVLVDAAWQGQLRKLMLQANRNGFFYVFDRRDGALLLANRSSSI